MASGCMYCQDKIAYKSRKPHNSWGFLYKIEMRHLMICLQNVRYLGDSYIKEFILRASRGILVSRFYLRYLFFCEITALSIS